jgi:hypothetical protein
MKKFKSTEEGIWNEVIRKVVNEATEKTYVPATPEDTAKLEEIYLANKPRLSQNIEYKLISASIKMNENSKSGNIKARINGRYINIEMRQI